MDSPSENAMEGCNLLGEVHYEELGKGRVRCIETGHEMPEATKSSYSGTKKCRIALFEVALSQRRPPLDLFDQSPMYRDKIVCKLTGAIMNKREEAVWKHMMGRKFLRKLGEREGEEKDKEKANVISDRCVQNGSRDSKQVFQKEDHPSSKNGAGDERSNGKSTGKTKELERTDGNTSETTNVDMDVNMNADMENDGEAKSEDLDFWIPPLGERWDFDSGDPDRWSSAPRSRSRKKIWQDEDASEGDAAGSLDSDFEMAEDVVSEDDRQDECGSDEEIDERVKRTSRAVGPSNFAGRKKKRREV